MKKGFTLIELSIVLVIIGLLIGGILVAKSMIGSAKINKITQMASQYLIAGRNFKTVYNYWPGDYPGGSFNCPGNGNGIIELKGGGCGGGSGAGEEGANYFYHLSAMNMLPDAYIITTNLTEIYTESGLKARLPKGLENNTHFIVFDFNTANPWGDPNRILGAGGVTSSAVELNSFFLFYSTDCMTISSFFNSNACSVLTPAEALAIDNKIDDGMPNTGNFVGTTGIDQDGSKGNFATCANDNASSYNVWDPHPAYAATPYNLNEKQPTCAVGWRITD